MDNKTIYALSTVYGKSGVAVIRISGEQSLQALIQLGLEPNLRPRYAYFSPICHPKTNEVLDNCLILYFKAPYSFTGEDIVELQTHGGRAVINSVLDALAQIPEIRLALPGEFSKRAFLNGKMDLTQAEGLADLIDAETKAQQKQAIKQMSGSLVKLYDTWRKDLINTLALIEALIDFPEEDIPEELINHVNENVANLKLQLKKHLNDNRKGEKLREGIKVAIVGEPNVGKSSLINLLVEREVAIVSDIPGTTRDVIEVYLDIAGFPFIIYDTAGLRESSDQIEKIGIEKAKQKLAEADFVIRLHSALDFQPGSTLSNNELVVINKIDLNHSLNIPANALSISVKDNKNLDQLINHLKNFASEFEVDEEDAVITRSRYREHCTFALNFLEQFNLDKPIELAAEDLRLASFEIGRITGRIDVEELLDVIFGSFCIGK
ncbi:tRNA uridine-5-carboxymethylaminomethyl(34) synthesis GTPase MnmE [Rickettsiales endosymbiont of Stachyamoeba lipophora]|uniref:tRNA uridine-5-carboxymethylaminomethyl(34) synthesis GTPase MnmE n=1 Tax=Rickettsiales endosymbiont of Stachyamoeba lipophora TaxID=2486578 RepID=UPI000F64E7F1|nr:tRNA uridine-5-carboxymethylaminomethyl(34) synthesis GTPase MnmE [Rickettsiales endosymbiont of Stachyamoeba lipophora]AZL15420.1 tRNA uridine-5-carboxymethylaminomethyl(34) synthesis GTPase MnmE [Rickettsiales endosymbiont of Stachyamoeba lipophora]